LGKIAMWRLSLAMGIRPRELASGEGWRVHDVICDSGPRDQPFEEQHSSICIALVTGGTFQYRTQQGSAVMAPGSLMLGNVGACFSCGHEHRAGDRCLSFRFSPAYFERIVASVPRARRIEFALPRLPPVQRLLPVLAEAQSIRDAAVESPGSRPWSSSLASRPHSAAVALMDGAELEEVALWLAGDVCSVLADGSSACPAFTGRDERRVTAAVRGIEARSSERLSLHELAREATMSPYHFLRVFARVVGVTPGQYILRTRLSRAAVLLRRSSLSVARVAADSGFGDLSTFNRQFRRAMRMSPNVYRARAKSTR
jgi:AraC family transcriptional regulator